MRAKIVATLGPATSELERVEALIDHGLAVARVNMAHGDHDAAAAVIRTVREAASRQDRPIAIMADLAGPKIRTGSLVESPIELEEGRHVVLTTDSTAGTAERIGVSYAGFPVDVELGQAILISDGLLKLTVLQIDGVDVHCRVDTGGELRSNQGINLPQTKIQTPTLTAKDRVDLEFCLEQGVDILAMSFVRSAEDIEELKRLVAQADRSCPIIAKIENHEAIPNLDGIIKAADGVMIARGDLGVEVPAEDVPVLQKKIIHHAQRYGKVSIVATQMLDSMIRLPRPTRAEVSDVANGVFDGADAVMLSGETAVGRYPVQSVAMMARIIERAESAVDYKDLLKARSSWAAETISGAISYATCHLASMLPAAAIVTSTESGRTAKQVSRYRPASPVIAVSPNQATVRQLMLWWGVVPREIKSSDNIDDVLKTALEEAKKSGIAQSGDKVVLTAGAMINVPGTTNLITVEQL